MEHCLSLGRTGDAQSSARPKGLLSSLPHKLCRTSSWDVATPGPPVLLVLRWPGWFTCELGTAGKGPVTRGAQLLPSPSSPLVAAPPALPAFQRCSGHSRSEQFSARPPAPRRDPLDQRLRAVFFPKTFSQEKGSAWLSLPPLHSNSLPCGQARCCGAGDT